MSNNPPQNPQPPGFRQHLVEEAYKFLIHPKVATHEPERKAAYLRKKGLTEEELGAAFAKAYGPGKAGSVAPDPSVSQGAVVSAYPLPPPPTLWVKVRDICNIILILTGAAYGIHYIFQRYIVPWLTGRKQKTVEESMMELQQSVVSVLKEVQTTLSSLEQTLSAQNVQIQALNNREGNQTSTKQLEQLRTEVSSLKGLLINKRTFPSTPSLAPSIPSWQRNKATEKPVEAAAESAVSLPNQVQAMGEGEALCPAPEAQEAASSEAKGVTGEAAEVIAMSNGETDEDAVDEKEFENIAEVPVEPTRP